MGKHPLNELFGLLGPFGPGGPWVPPAGHELEGVVLCASQPPPFSVATRAITALNTSNGMAEAVPAWFWKAAK